MMEHYQGLNGRIAFITSIVKKLQGTMPDVFARKDLPRFLGSSLPIGTIANMGKEGPPYIRQGRHAVYEKDAFLSWYENWLSHKATSINS